MNINLSAAASKKKKGTVGYGLNRRGRRSVLDDDGAGGDGDYDNNVDDNKDNDACVSAIDEVNRDLKAQQAALRKRAQEAAAYDFDGTYEGTYEDTTTAAKDKDKKASISEKTNNKGSSSRYVGDLLKNAERRQRERDLIYERRIAKEQKEEEKENDEFQDKEKFVTKSYKRKLAERELWAKEEEGRKQEEERQDVMKKKDGTAFASFYGNLNRNVAMGGAAAGQNEPLSNAVEEDGEPGNGGAAMPKRERATKRISITLRDDDDDDGSEGIEMHPADTQIEPSDSDIVIPMMEDKESIRIAERKIREEKVARARIRYFQRQGIPNGEDNAKQ